MAETRLMDLSVWLDLSMDYNHSNIFNSITEKFRVVDQRNGVLFFFFFFFWF